MISLTNLTAVEASPHLWMINVCRNSCAFCQSLAPRWERLADTLRNEASVAYWDAEQSFVPPALLGEVSSTPAIRAVLRPGRNQPQVALDYQGLREPDELARFARAHMPDHVRRIEDEESWAALEAAASEERLARVAVFTDRAGGSPTPPLLKRLSAEFEARLLLAEVLGLLPDATGGGWHQHRFLWSHAPTYARLFAFLESLAAQPPAPLANISSGEAAGLEASAATPAPRRDDRDEL